MTLFLTTALIIFLASALQAATGFGFSILAVPLLLLIHSSSTAIELNLIITVFLCLTMQREIRKDIDKKLLQRLITCGILGAPIGLAVLLYINNRTFELMIAILTILFIGLLLLKLRFKRSYGGDYTTGILAGGFTSAVGMGGIPLLLYFAGTNTDKTTARATAVAFFLFIYTFALVMQMVVSESEFPVWWYSLGMVPLSFAGIQVGRWLFYKLSQRTFSILIYSILLANSIFLIFK